MESFHLGFCRAVCPGPPPALVSIVLPFLHYSRPCAAPRSFSVLGVLLVFCSLGHDGRVQPLRGHLARALLRLLVFAMERVHIPVRWLPIVLPSRQVSASHRECPPHFTRFSSASATSSTSPQPGNSPSPSPACFTLGGRVSGRSLRAPQPHWCVLSVGQGGSPLLLLASVSHLGQAVQ